MAQSLKKFLYSSVAVLLLFPSIVLAQGFQTGAITVVAKDATGSAVPGVTVTVTSEERGTQRTAVTDATGTALIAVLPTGFYRIEGALAGFNTVVRKANKVDADKTTEVPLTMSLAATSETITVTGQQPVIDRTNVTDVTQLSTKEFEKAPIGARGYQTLALFTPGVIVLPGANTNPQVHGAQNTGNVFLFDGVDTTDTTTGTFGSNLNFEAIQEISVQTSGLSAEYGRASGAVMNIITKSGTNRFEGSAKSIQTNDAWDAQNTARNQVTGASLARSRIRHNNYVYTGTLGGPVWRDHLWFFGAYETTTNVAPPRTTTVSQENYVQRRTQTYPSYRVTAQITPTQTIWGRYSSDPDKGIIRNDYWPGGATELYALTAQDQGGNNKTVQYSGIFGNSVTTEVLWAKSQSGITVDTYKLSPLTNGAPHQNLADGLYYNGATYSGSVDRPREQWVGGASYFTTIGGNSHNFKAGIDYQKLESGSFFRFPNSQLYIDNTFDWQTRAYDPFLRLDFVDAPSTSAGRIMGMYVRDKFDVSRRLFVEAGLRYEKETAKSDIGTKVLDTTGLAPRLQASFDLKGTGSTLLTATAGRFYQSVVLAFADAFANVPQIATYSLYQWDPDKNDYVFAKGPSANAANTLPNLGLNATYIDEVTLGAQQQLGPTIGVGIRGIYRKWNDLIDDVLTFNENNDVVTTYVNEPSARRNYKGVELTFEKRFSHNWNLLANYTYSQVRGDHFVTTASQLQDFVGSKCKGTDPSIGDNGVIPCADVNSSQRLSGHPIWDVPNLVNVLGSYAFHVGPVSMTAGTAGFYSSGAAYSKSRTLSVLDNSGAPSGRTVTYFYEGQGSDRSPNWWRLDGSLEATYRIFGVDIGAKGEVFNLFNQETPVAVSNTAWCNTTATATCATAVARYGTYTGRGSFLRPRNFRLTALVRF